MSLDSNSESFKYLKILKQSIKLRKEISGIAEKISEIQFENKGLSSEISNLEAEFKELKRKRLQALIKTPIQNNFEVSCSSPTAASTNFSYTLCSSVKKVHTKEYQVTAFTEGLQEETDLTGLRFFEKFLVIGLKQQGKFLFEPFTQDILYSYPNTMEIGQDLLNEIQYLAFPTKIVPEKFILGQEIIPQVCEVLFSIYYRNGNSFTVILPSDLESKAVSPLKMNEKKQLYCCFVIFSELGLSKNNKFQFIVPRCYCLLTYFPCLELHFEILYRLLSIKKSVRFSNGQDFESNSNIFNENNLKVITDQEMGLIQRYYEYFSECLFEKNMRVSINLQTVESIDYTFPSNSLLLDTLWLCPLLFSLISIDDFYFLLVAVLQEKQIIFRSQNFDFLSSCVLGFHSMIFPFKWQHPVYPVYSESIHSKLINSNSYIIGIFEKIPSSVKTHNYIFYDIDKKLLIYDNDVKFPHSYDLVGLIRNEYLTNFSEQCYLPNEFQIQSAKFIVEEITKFCKWTVEEILAYCDTKNFMDFQIYREIIKSHAGSDQEFFSNVLNTDMFLNAFSQG